MMDGKKAVNQLNEALRKLHSSGELKQITGSAVYSLVGKVIRGKEWTLETVRSALGNIGDADIKKIFDVGVELGFGKNHDSVEAEPETTNEQIQPSTSSESGSPIEPNPEATEAEEETVTSQPDSFAQDSYSTPETETKDNAPAVESPDPHTVAETTEETQLEYATNRSSEPVSANESTAMAFDFNDSSVYQPRYPDDVPRAEVHYRRGKVIVEWTPADEPAIYRVLSSDIEEEAEPGAFDQDWGATTESSLTLPYKPLSLTQVVNVWKYPYQESGVVTSTPELYAVGYVVAPVSEEKLKKQVTDNQVNFQWENIAGAGTTLVFKLEKTACRQVRRRGVDTLISDHTPVQERTTSSFDAVNLNRGETHYFVFVNKVIVDLEDEPFSVYSSEPTISEVSIQARLEQVKLDYEMRYDETGKDPEPKLDLYYQEVPGDVRIYRSTERPNANISGLASQQKIVTESELESLGLTEDKIIRKDSYPVEDKPGLRIVRDLPWEYRATEIFLTPVSYSKGKCLVGETVQVYRVLVSSKFECHDRVTYKQLVFNWPAGADNVQIFIKADDEPPRPDEVPARTVSKEMYSDIGGINTRDFSSNQRNYLFMRGATTSNRKLIVGPSIRTTNEPLACVSYSFTTETFEIPAQGFLQRKEQRVLGKLFIVNLNEFPISNCPDLVLASSDLNAPLVLDRSIYPDLRAIPVFQGIDQQGVPLYQQNTIQMPPQLQPNEFMTLYFEINTPYPIFRTHRLHFAPENSKNNRGFGIRLISYAQFYEEWNRGQNRA